MNSDVRAKLAQRIHAMVDGSSTESIEPLLLDVHRWQAEHDPVLRSLTLGPVEHWTQIPAVPVDLFKQLPIGTVREHEKHVLFRTSGTTAGVRGCHRLRDTRLYDHGALTWFRTCVPQCPPRTVALLLDPDVAPDSSLSHMVAHFARQNAGPVSWHLHGGSPDVTALNRTLARSSDPAFVPTTAFALAHWLLQDPAPLPKGSVLMITGGFKGRVHALSQDALYEEATKRLAPARLVTEYGMTELSSQLWGTPDTPYVPPPWMKVLPIDPATGSPRDLPAQGQPARGQPARGQPARGQPARGQLRFMDLCNLDSTLAIDTMDEGIVHADGRVELLGRLAGATARGCSLTVEEAWLKAPP